MRRSITMIVGISVVTVVIVVTVAWFFFVQQTRTAINQWAEIQRANGTDVTWQDLRFSGYPLRIDAHIDTPQMIVRQRDRQATWKPSFLTFKFSSISPIAIEFVSPGTHDINVTYGDTASSVVIEAETLQGQALFPPGDYQRIRQVSGRFSGVRVTPFAWDDPVTIGRGNFEATQDNAARIDPAAVHPQGESFVLELAVQEIGFPLKFLQGNALESLGAAVNAFSAEIQVKGKLDAGSNDIETLTIWRDGGGTVELTTIELDWGPLRLTANGTMALDSELQPVGSFATRIAGLEEFITAMEKGGVLSPSDAAIARITLAVLTRASDDDGPDRAEIPITLQERTLRLGPVALIQFPPIVWE